MSLSNARFAVLISPESKSAYFSETESVIQNELLWTLEDLAFRFHNIANLQFILFDQSLTKHQFYVLSRMSFFQGLFEIVNGLMRPIELIYPYLLSEDFVFGSKYKGKTNEHLTQLLLNVGLAKLDVNQDQKLRLLDPMCGRGTSLFWAAQYGMDAVGIEQDKKALSDITRNTKKWCKLNHQKHKFSEGFLGGKKNNKSGHFIQFEFPKTHIRVIHGDSQASPILLKKQKFDLIVSDLPYGVQHFTADGERNPLKVIENSISGWANCLKPKGIIVLAFNSLNPKRNLLSQVFINQGYKVLSFSATHRMSESIVRDVLVLQK